MIQVSPTPPSPSGISDAVAELLICPVTRQALHPADAVELARWSSDRPFEGAFVTADGSIAYPVRDGFPHLVAAEALHRA